MMTENPMHNKDHIWRDSSTDGYIEIKEEDTPHDGMPTSVRFILISMVSVLVMGGICYAVVLCSK